VSLDDGESKLSLTASHKLKRTVRYPKINAHNQKELKSVITVTIRYLNTVRNTHGYPNI
jgi:hypothetical protein